MAPRLPSPRCRRGLLPALLALLLAAGAARADTPAWPEIKRPHVIVAYAGDRGFAEQVARRAEADYDRIAQELDITRHGGFWLFDRRARIHVYATRDAYLAASGAPAWSAGRADYTRRAILTYQGSASFIDSVLPHELTHLIFREFIGFGTAVPLWLDEGVAQWQDVPNRPKVEAMARRLMREGRLLRVPDLTAADPRRGATAQGAVEFYAQAASLVGFLRERYGRARFRECCGHLRDGRSLDDALRFTYGVELRNVAALDDAWRAHLEVVSDEDGAGRLYAH